jgi:hypothetical protein
VRYHGQYSLLLHALSGRQSAKNRFFLILTRGVRAASRRDGSRAHYVKAARSAVGVFWLLWLQISAALLTGYYARKSEKILLNLLFVFLVMFSIVPRLAPDAVQSHTRPTTAPLYLVLYSRLGSSPPFFRSPDVSLGAWYEGNCDRWRRSGGFALR